METQVEQARGLPNGTPVGKQLSSVQCLGRVHCTLGFRIVSLTGSMQPLSTRSGPPVARPVVEGGGDWDAKPDHSVATGGSSWFMEVQFTLIMYGNPTYFKM